DKPGALAQMHACLRPGGRLSLAEVIPRHAQRLSMLVDLTELDSDLVARLRAAEESMYQTPTDALVNWDVPDLEVALVAVGFTLVSALQCDTQVEERRITAAHLERWLTVSMDAQRPPSAPP